MKKIGIVLIIIVAIVALLAFTLIGSYNKMVSLQEKVDNASANIENALQRRMDLIPDIIHKIENNRAAQMGVLKDIRNEIFSDASVKKLLEEIMDSLIHHLVLMRQYLSLISYRKNLLNMQY